MNKKTLTALQGSIKKWEKIVAGKMADHGQDNCPLCKLFFEEKGCRGCPVREATGAVCCYKTPYETWSEHQWDRKRSHQMGEYRVYDEADRKLAQAELDFLRSLLPSSTGDVREG